METTHFLPEGGDDEPDAFTIRRGFQRPRGRQLPGQEPAADFQSAKVAELADAPDLGLWWDSLAIYFPNL